MPKLFKTNDVHCTVKSNDAKSSTGGNESACHEQLQAVRVEWVNVYQLLNDYSFMFASQMLNS